MKPQAYRQPSNLTLKITHLKQSPLAFIRLIMKSRTFPSLVWPHDTAMIYGPGREQRAEASTELWGDIGSSWGNGSRYERSPFGMHRVKWLTLVICRGQGTCDSDAPAVINIEQPLTTETTLSYKHGHTRRHSQQHASVHNTHSKVFTKGNTRTWTQTTRTVSKYCADWIVGKFW